MVISESDTARLINVASYTSPSVGMTAVEPNSSEYPMTSLLSSDVELCVPVENWSTCALSMYTATFPLALSYVMMYVCFCASEKMLPSVKSVVQTRSSVTCPIADTVPTNAARQLKFCCFPRYTTNALLPDRRDVL